MGSLYFSLLVLACIAATAIGVPVSRQPAVGECVSSCEGVSTGIYQSCEGCDVFVQCIHGRLVEGYKCPPGKTYDDTAKQCVWWSSTCGVEPNNGTCISTCLDVPNGNYQSCRGCRVYVVCSENLRYDDALCFPGLYWDDNDKQCVRESSTCPTLDPVLLSSNSSDVPEEVPEPVTCVSSCKGVEDGDYQSCSSCDAFIKCASGELYEMACPLNGLVWDDHKKRCEYESATCPIPEDEEDGSDAVTADDSQEIAVTTEVPHPDIEVSLLRTLTIPAVGECVASCKNVPNGIYQSCEGCDRYVMCHDGLLWKGYRCPPGKVYDDTAKQCIYYSSTCDVPPNNGTCVSTCLNMPNNDYHSCYGCGYYVTCSESIRYDERPCLPGLSWDDSKKRCVTESTTCSSS